MAHRSRVAARYGYAKLDFNESIFPSTTAPPFISLRSIESLEKVESALVVWIKQNQDQSFYIFPLWEKRLWYHYFFDFFSYGENKR